MAARSGGSELVNRAPDQHRQPCPVLVVGVDDAAPRTVPESLSRRIKDADLVCGGERHFDHFSEIVQERLVIKAPLSDVLERIEDAHRSHKKVVVLASGDPCCFGIGPLVAERLGREHVEIIPSVSSVQLLFARLGEPWQHVRILSAHGRPIEPVIGPALSARYSAILADDQHSPARIAAALLDAGMENCRAVVGERLGGPAERIIDGTLASIVDQTCDPLSVLALFRGQADIRVPRIGLAERLYHHRDGMITKSEIRAVSLGHLAIQPGDIVWDIGAGCGSVGLEAASLVDSGFVYAIERDAQQVELIHRNLKTFPSPLRIIFGEAPEALAELPSPDAVFAGGSGGNLEKIVDVALKRLRPGGRLVANFVILEHMLAFQRQVQLAGWSCDVSQVSVSRGDALGRLGALNPIFVLKAARISGGSQ